MPNQPSENNQSLQNRTRKIVKISSKNQDSNIKISRQTKDQIDILMKLTDNKFAYERSKL